MRRKIRIGASLERGAKIDGIKKMRRKTRHSPLTSQNSDEVKVTNYKVIM